MRALVIGLAVLIVGAYLLVPAADEDLSAWLGLEDGLVENAGALFFLVSGVAFLAVSARWIRSVGDPGLRSNRAISFAVVGFLMLVCCGEELSWGQRIFGWETPAAMAEINAQNETNLHNIQLVHQKHPDGTEKGFVAKLINMNRLFSIFWLTVFVALPVAVKNSERLRWWAERHWVPVPPLWIGGLFLTGFIVYKVLATLHTGTLTANTLDEVKETVYASIYALAGIFAVIDERTRSVPM